MIAEIDEQNAACTVPAYNCRNWSAAADCCLVRNKVSSVHCVNSAQGCIMFIVSTLDSAVCKCIADYMNS